MKERLLKEIIVSKEEIEIHCKRLAKEIEEDYKGKDTTIFLGLLKGCHPFMTDLLKYINLDLEIDYMDVSSYFGGTTGEEEVKIIRDMTSDVKGRDIIIVEDIIDSGRTLSKVIELLYKRGANNIDIVTILDKPSGREEHVDIKYIGTEVPDAFLIGYGLDYQEKYRNLDCVGIPKDNLIKENNE